MLLHCPSRKCNTTRDHKLKVSSNEAICMDCGEINNMITDFTKKAMETSGDIYRSVETKKAFMYKCSKCTIDRGVKIVDEQALCETCNHPLNLSAPMLQAIKQAGGAKVEMKQAVEAKAEINKGVIKRRSE